MKKYIGFFSMLWIAVNIVAQPVSLCSENSHYYFYKGKPEILITSAEHYGAVVNNKFDYDAYFNWLASYGLNATRIFPGALTEPVDKYIKGNTLGVKPDDIIMPWARSDEPGYAMGGNKFNLDKWDERYFNRLHDFIEKAAAKNIVVEICFFNAQAPDCWPICPLYYKNNIQSIGRCDFKNVQTLKDTALVKKQADYIAKIVQEVNEYDNVVLELCDEPITYGTSLVECGKWLDHHIDIIYNTEKDLPKKHLIAQQIEGPVNGPCDFSDDKRISVITCQYVYMAAGDQEGGMFGLDYKYNLNKPIEMNETYYYPLWYKGDSIADSRVEAWEFIVGGGGSFNQLNGQYTVENPAGSTPDNAKICNSLKALKEFMYSSDFVKMKQDKEFIAGGIPGGSFCRSIGWRGNQYALYIHHSTYDIWQHDNVYESSAAYIVTPGKYKDTLVLKLPKGKYNAEWIDPASGAILNSELINQKSGNRKVITPVYSIDIALRIKKAE